jgi:hypothetical protein
MPEEGATVVGITTKSQQETATRRGGRHLVIQARDEVVARRCELTLGGRQRLDHPATHALLPRGREHAREACGHACPILVMKEEGLASENHEAPTILREQERPVRVVLGSFVLLVDGDGFGTGEALRLGVCRDQVGKEPAGELMNPLAHQRRELRRAMDADLQMLPTPRVAHESEVRRARRVVGVQALSQRTITRNTASSRRWLQ